MEEKEYAGLKAMKIREAIQEDTDAVRGVYLSAFAAHEFVEGKGPLI